MGAIDKIHEFEKFGSVLGLERITELLKRLGDPHKGMKVVHVAGTNGKGSVCRYIYEVLEAAGLKTGIYTSPFIEKFNERIEFDHAYISDEDLESYTDRVIKETEAMVADGHDSPTEFEVITATAFLYYKEKAADCVVLEVGLGGRGDSTNVIDDPLCSVITSISFDHTERLGNTIAKIAFEKAGIIKAGRPVVSSTGKAEAKEVISSKAKELGCEWIDSSELAPEIIRDSIDGTEFSCVIGKREYKDISISMTGEYQVENALCALSAIDVLRDQGTAITDEAVRKGMKIARQPARFEIMSRDPYVIIDGAHNPDGALQLKRICEKYLSGKKLLFVTGILKDKAVDEILEYFSVPASEFIATEPGNPRKLDAASLAEKIRALGKPCEVFEDPIEAVDRALERKAGFDAVIVCGSLYLAGAVRGHIREKRAEELVAKSRKYARGIRAVLSETDEYERLVDFFIENGLEYDAEEEVDTDIVKCFKITVDDDKLAAAACLAKREGRYIIDGIATDPAYRGHKLGKILLDRVVKEVKSLDGDSIYLVARAPGFFRKYGFVTIDPDDAPNFFECRYCDQYGVSCFPEVMKLDI